VSPRRFWDLIALSVSLRKSFSVQEILALNILYGVLQLTRENEGLKMELGACMHLLKVPTPHVGIHKPTSGKIVSKVFVVIRTMI
jgi:hypothetical protein